MLVILLKLAALAAVCWSLWTRRDTWRYRCPFEIGASASVALGGATLILLAPFMTATVGVWLHHSTGRYGLNLCAAHLFGIAASSSTVYNAAIRLEDDDEAFARKFIRFVQYPMRITAVFLLVLFWMSATPRHYRGSLVDMHVDGWLRMYWALLCSAYIYLLCYAGRKFLAMRHDPESRPVARIYLGAAFAGIVACSDRIVLAVNPEACRLGPDHPVLKISGLLCIGGFAVGAGYSWMRHLRMFPEPSDDLVSH